MKFYLVFIFSLFLALFAHSQTQLAIRGGFNYSTARVTFQDIRQPVGFVPGGNFGIQLRTVFDGMLHFAPIVAYSMKGYVIKSDTSSNKTRNLIHYIDLAPQLSIDIALKNNNRLIIGAGPVASLAIAGTEKNTINGITTSSKMKFSTVNSYGLFDMGLQGSIGYHFKKLFLEAAYQYGFMSINNNEEKDKKNLRNRVISLNMGYYFQHYK